MVKGSKGLTKNKKKTKQQTKWEMRENHNNDNKKTKSTMFIKPFNQQAAAAVVVVAMPVQRTKMKAKMENATII